MAQQSKSQFGYRRHADQDRTGTEAAQYPVVAVGGGPGGLSVAIDLAQRGVPVVLLDDADRIGEGSRAICLSKRSLEYWDRLGVGGRMVDKGVVWSVGRMFDGASLLYEFNLLPEHGHKRPAFINLQQFYAEAYLVDRVQELAAIDLRWRNKVIGLEQRNDHVALTIETPDGPYRIRANYVVACDGARSSLRQMVGAEFAGQVFEDQFLIADVRMTAEFPTERWKGYRRKPCSRAITRREVQRPTRTSGNRPAPPISWHRAPARKRDCGRRCCCWRRKPNSAGA